MLTCINDYISLFVIIFLVIMSFRLLISTFKNPKNNQDKYSFSKYEDNEDE